MAQSSYLCIAVVALLCATACGAQDRVGIRYLSGYPVPDKASETTSISIARDVQSSSSGVPVDRYFDQVDQILVDNKIDSDCVGFVYVDGPFVEATIEANGKKRRLVSALDQNGSPLRAAQPDDAQLRCGKAMASVIKLSFAQAQSRLLGSAK